MLLVLGLELLVRQDSSQHLAVQILVGFVQDLLAQGVLHCFHS